MSKQRVWLLTEYTISNTAASKCASISTFDLFTITNETLQQKMRPQTHCRTNRKISNIKRLFCNFFAPFGSLLHSYFCFPWFFSFAVREFSYLIVIVTFCPVYLTWFDQQITIDLVRHFSFVFSQHSYQAVSDYTKYSLLSLCCCSQKCSNQEWPF